MKLGDAIRGCCPLCSPRDRHVEPVICARHDAILECRRAWLDFGAAIVASLPGWIRRLVR